MAPCSVPFRALDDKYNFISRLKTATSPPPPPRFSKTHSLHTATNVCLAASARFFVEDRADEGRLCSATTINVCPLLADVGGLFLRLSANVHCPLSTRSSRTHPKRKEKFPCI